MLSVYIISVSLLMVISCKTTKDISKERISEQVQSAVIENIKTTTETGATTDTKTTAETTVTESFDTVVSILPLVDGVLADKPIFVPLKVTRTIHRKEFTDQRQTSQQKGTVASNRKEQLIRKSDIQKSHRKIERTGLPGWVVVIILITIGAIIIICKRKFF